MKWASAAGLYAALTVAMCWPLVSVLTTGTTQPNDDPLLNAWIMWWNTQQTPLSAAWWNAPFFFPTMGAFAMSEVLLGLAPLTTPIIWLTGDPVLAHNVAVLVSFPLSALAAYALGFELTRRHDAAVLAGLAFGFSAFRANEVGHVQMLSYYWTPLALAALHRYLRTGRSIWTLAFAGACLLQVLCNGYALFQQPVLIALWVVWFATTWRQVGLIATAWIASTLPLLPLLITYREVQQRLNLGRALADILRFSADISSLAAAPVDNVIWGRVLTSAPEYGLFPGITVLLCLVGAGYLAWRARRSRGADEAPRQVTRVKRARIAFATIAVLASAASLSAALIGPWTFGPFSIGRPYKATTWAIVAIAALFLLSNSWRWVWRSRSALAFYALATAAMYVMAFGPEPRLFGHRVFYKAPYAWLLEFPGFHSIRAPNRFAMLAVLCLAAALAIAWTRFSLAGRRRGLWLAIAAGVTLEGWFVPRVTALPSLTRPDWGDAHVLIELPMGPAYDTAAMYGFIRTGEPQRALVNGTSGYTPPHYVALTESLAEGDARPLLVLAERGSLAIGIDRTAAGGGAIERGVAALPGSQLVSQSVTSATYRLAEITSVRRDAGSPLPIARVSATPFDQEAYRLHDGRVDSMWSSGLQQGVEAVQLDLQATERVGAVVTKLGTCVFGFPRRLVIETSLDGHQWNVVWEGSTATETVRAALDDPHDVPIVISFPPEEARFLRLRQMQQRSDALPWCIAEIEVRRPATPRFP